MKKIILLLLLSLLIYSCSSDSSGDELQNETFSIPLNTNNYWTYDVSDNLMNTFRDSLYVGNDIIMNSKTYKEMKVKNDVSFGFYSSSLKDNGVRVDGNRLLLSGDISLNVGQNSPINLDLTLDDFVVFDADAPLNENPSTKTGIIQQVISGFPLTINYTLKSVGGQSFSNYTSLNGDVYSNVKSGKIVLTASITTVQEILGNPITVNVLPQQDVLISEQFIAENIGVVHTNTLTTYTLSTLPPQILDNLNFPSFYSATQNEFLDTYLIN
ncbi:hypothetical protein FIA58_014140 [Flavobacterium jejuense]|uniref:Uncharacterized protein n=1 Tax=Flavobacterium jejuense TaxID=1544455 RepID=A0ABX0IUE7_9FLAO|nr:hypothetical protein [Flavobacterium jejuense]NHN26821.1 hypothetical protein [Flavobacterium jejuense]